MEWADRTDEVTVEREIDSLVEAAGNGDLRQKIENDYQGDFHKLTRNFNASLSNLREIVASLNSVSEQVQSSVGEIATDNARQANQVSSSARETAEKGREVVFSAIQAMDQINTASNKIAEIIGVIDEIAFQTNLLALNASVEAAKEIKELIQDSVHKVQAGSELVNQAITSMDEITQQNAALAEQTSSASQAVGQNAGELKQLVSFFQT